MTTRYNYFEHNADAIALLMQQEAYLKEQFNQHPDLNSDVWELLKLRVSQINQCAFCVDLHSHALRAAEAWDDKIYGLSAWRDMPFYTPLERFVLDWAEHHTAAKRVTEEDYKAALEHVDESALFLLTMAVNAINSWNRIAKTFKTEVGSFRP